jgi:hypothetical protein
MSYNSELTPAPYLKVGGSSSCSASRQSGGMKKKMGGSSCSASRQSGGMKKKMGGSSCSSSRQSGGMKRKMGGGRGCSLQNGGKKRTKRKLSKRRRTKKKYGGHKMVKGGSGYGAGTLPEIGHVGSKLMGTPFSEHGPIQPAGSPYGMGNVYVV